MLWASFNLKSVSRAQISLVVSCYFGAFMEHMQICGLWSITWQVNKIHKTRCDSRIAVCKALVPSAQCQLQSPQEYSLGNGSEGLSGAQQTEWLLSQSWWWYRGAGTWSNPAAAQSPPCLKTKQINCFVNHWTAELIKVTFQWIHLLEGCRYTGITDTLGGKIFRAMKNLRRQGQAEPLLKPKMPKEKTQMWKRQH